MNEDATPAVEPAAAPLRVLLVEDDEFDVAVFSRAFYRSDIACEIIRCRTGEEALDGLRDAELELDLVVSDHQLPGVSGFDLCLQLIERFRSEPAGSTEPPFALVLLTGVGSEQMAIRALRAGIHDYIVKDSSSEYLELLPLVLPKVARRHRRRRVRQLAQPGGAHPEGPPEAPVADRPATGLGLAACAELVKDRGGRIWVENGNGEAPALHFSVPLAPGEVAFWRAGAEPPAGEAAASVPAASVPAAGVPAAGAPAAGAAAGGGVQPPAEPPAEPPADSRHVLIAHPNPIVTFVAQRTVERSGCRCATFENGDKALEALDREPFDLVLMGLESPKLDGLETARRIRRREQAAGGQRLPILALGAAEDDAERWHGAGMDGAVALPVSARSVQAAIASLG